CATSCRRASGAAASPCTRASSTTPTTARACSGKVRATCWATLRSTSCRSWPRAGRSDETVTVFDVDTLVADCQAARADAEPRRATREVLERALANSAAMADALQPFEGGLEFLHRGPDLTVLHIVWAPKMRLYPHDHRMWAAIGIYTGHEDNAFFRRDP